MSSELELLKQQVINLETENAKLKQIIEEIANLRIENTKLKQIIKQNRTTNNVSQSSVSPSLSVTLQTPIPSSIIAHSGTDNNTNSVNLEQTQSAISPEINSNNNLDHPSSAEKVENILDNTYNHSMTASNNSDIHQESIISSHEVPASSNFETQQELETSTSPIPAETISLEEKEENEFLDSMYKETVSKEIMERIKEKKLRNQELLSTPDILHEQSLIQENAKKFPSRNVTIGKKTFRILMKLSPLKVNIVSPVSLEITEHQLSQVTTQRLVRLFQNAIRARHEEILSWYYYSDSFENKVIEICREVGVTDKTARTQLYKEIWSWNRKN
ncbi:hypothetical protein Glove_199g103 [Diversispora epigaea]|uniref:Uncharacterized protein n=1 Tax=Diversispora epigaea TaxID=1348612 RepID=A0A397IK15_9GLOM|nr:hypothetical protein Glove_199g103 [Diversispora epigaea]